ncbi:MAG: DUF4093 domain-containing protein [Clostridia bacterium]|nr:DUF4093 domain-containing protein [Clostridia bacterium]
MVHIHDVIVVEGKYDKERLRKLTDAPIICTHGFHLYRNKAILQSIRQLAKTRGVLILTDSDRAGFRIRNYLKSCLGNTCSIKNLYIPAIFGKERRKDVPGKDGLLGVEGMTDQLLLDLLSTVATLEEEDITFTPVTKADFCAMGYSGKPDSAQRRQQLSKKLNLPPRMSANALLELINRIGGMELLSKL